MTLHFVSLDVEDLEFPLRRSDHAFPYLSHACTNQ